MKKKKGMRKKEKEGRRKIKKDKKEEGIRKK